MLMRWTSGLLLACLLIGCASASRSTGGSEATRSTTTEDDVMARLLGKYVADGRALQCVETQLNRLNSDELTDFAELVVPDPGTWHDVTFTGTMRDVTKKIEEC